MKKTTNSLSVQNTENNNLNCRMLLKTKQTKKKEKKVLRHFFKRICYFKHICAGKLEQALC